MTVRFDNLVFGTQPVVIHANGGWHESVTQYMEQLGLYRDWQGCYVARGSSDRYFPEEILDALAQYDPRPEPQLSIITWNNYDYEWMTQRQLRRWGCDYHNGLAPGTDFFSYVKLTSTAEWIKTVKTPYVMGLDAKDVLLLAHPSEVLRRFREMDRRMLLNAETNDYPACVGRVEQLSPPCSSPFHFLNSGVYIAETEFFRDYLETALSFKEELEASIADRHAIDQGSFKKALDVHYGDAWLDYRCEIFQCLYGCTTQLVQLTKE